VGILAHDTTRIDIIFRGQECPRYRGFYTLLSLDLVDEKLISGKIMGGYWICRFFA